MPWSLVADSSRQTETIECIQAFEEIYDSDTSFSDKKIFTMETPSNSQNDCVYASVKAKRDVLLIFFQIVHLPAE